MNLKKSESLEKPEKNHSPTSENLKTLANLNPYCQLGRTTLLKLEPT
jgi:hypothetical protein